MRTRCQKNPSRTDALPRLPWDRQELWPHDPNKLVVADESSRQLVADPVADGCRIDTWQDHGSNPVSRIRVRAIRLHTPYFRSPSFVSRKTQAVTDDSELHGLPFPKIRRACLASSAYGRRLTKRIRPPAVHTTTIEPVHWHAAPEPRHIQFRRIKQGTPRKDVTRSVIRGCHHKKTLSPQENTALFDKRSSSNLLASAQTHG